VTTAVVGCVELVGHCGEVLVEIGDALAGPAVKPPSTSSPQDPGRPDLYRGGSPNDPNYQLRTPDNPYSDGSFDIQPDASGNVGPGSGGWSTSSEPNSNWKHPWKYPGGAQDPDGIRIFKDSPNTDPDHWLWEPDWEMPLPEFKQRLKNTFPYWVPE